MSTYIPHDGWHSGKPPHPGWWAVQSGKDIWSSTKRLRFLRWSWWDGESWSIAVYRDTLPMWVGTYASVTCEFPERVWSHYYPEGARVPRVKP